ncbi:unnamed protein product [Ectocarpus sp. 12 AP-2014]
MRLGGNRSCKTTVQADVNMAVRLASYFARLCIRRQLKRDMSFVSGRANATACSRASSVWASSPVPPTSNHGTAVHSSSLFFVKINAYSKSRFTSFHWSAG